MEGKLTCRECIKRIYKQSGIRGFYKGISASYFGVSETVVHLVIYESIKAHLQQKTNHDRQSIDESIVSGSVEAGDIDNLSYSKDSFLTSDYLKCMLAGACSKTCATSLCYPHGE